MAGLQKALGYRIKSLRGSNKMTQEELAELANLHNTYIGAIERGERNPSLKSIEQIASALNVPISDLFKFVDQDTNASIDYMKSEVFSLLKDKDKKTINFLLGLIKYILIGLKQFSNHN
jgi:transcriptional regulator with XRE-family HTH domain